MSTAELRELHRRLTRAEPRAETGARLLEAAAEVFAERGFHGASVEDISERAGYTRGAFYANFDDKDAVFLALVDERLESNISGVADVLRDARTPAEALA